MRNFIHIKTIALGLLLGGLFPLGAQAVDLTSPQQGISARLEGLEGLQPDGSASDISVYVGIATLIVIFADDAQDADYIAQLDILRDRVDAFARRDVVLLTDTAPCADGPMRQSLRPRGFGILLIDTEGTLKQRRRTVTDARTLIRQIDEMP